MTLLKKRVFFVGIILSSALLAAAFSDGTTGWDPLEPSRIEALYQKAGAAEKIKIKNDGITSYYRVVTNEPAKARAISALVRKLAERSSENRLPLSCVMGTQTIGPKYGFTSEDRLLETARKVLSMGSDILKISLATKAYSMKEDAGISNLVDLVSRQPSFKAVFDMPFQHYVLWTYEMPDPVTGKKVSFRDGLDEWERKRIHDEFYGLTKYLLEHYNKSGKVFLLGHWEGDWTLLGDLPHKPESEPTQDSIEGMIQWLNVRQAAIDEAKKDTPHEGVNVFHYTEVNLAVKAMRGGATVTTKVLPFTTVDFVSYSSYDGTSPAKDNRKAMEELLLPLLDYIESNLPPKDIAGKRVWLGEYGLPNDNVSIDTRLQDSASRTVVATALKWGCPYALYWEMYNNEITKDGKHKGYWLITDQGNKVPLFETHQKFLEKAKTFISQTREKTGSVPSQETFNRQAVDWLGD